MTSTIHPRWITSFAAGIIILVFGLSETASAPPAASAVRIVDATDASQIAHVDANGNLHVLGTVGISSNANAVSVDTSTPLDVTSADDPARMAFQDNAFFSISEFELLHNATIIVPGGQRLVLTHFSAHFSLPTGQSITDVQVDAGSPGLYRHHFVPVLIGNTGTRDFYAISEDATIYSDGNLFVHVSRSAATGSTSIDVGVSGYLIDCTTYPCN
jgi:hypothetical protein